MTDAAVEEQHGLSHDPHEHAHPDEKQYLLVALVLAVLTAIEVALYYITGLPDNALVLMLGVLAIVKFVIVVMYFMHLKFDSPIFRRFFITGIVLAIVVYTIVLATFHVWGGSQPTGGAT